MSDTKKKEKKSTEDWRHVKCVRHERDKSVAVNICRTVTDDGMPFLYLSPSKSWKKGTKQGYNTKFMSSQVEALIDVLAAAAKWIDANPHAADVDYEPEPTAKPANQETNGVSADAPF